MELQVNQKYMLMVILDGNATKIFTVDFSSLSTNLNIGGLILEHLHFRRYS